MDLFQSITALVSRLDAAGLRYALIGGMAMAFRGVQRATFDVDFLLMLEDVPQAESILETEGYRCVFKSTNVSHYQKEGTLLSRVDVLHAFRGPSLGMLARAERMPLGDACLVPVVRIEDLIGLKIQASVNAPERAPGDWNDIHHLIMHAAATGVALDWALIEDYLTIFDLVSKLTELTALYARHL